MIKNTEVVKSLLTLPKTQKYFGYVDATTGVEDIAATAAGVGGGGMAIGVGMVPAVTILARKGGGMNGTPNEFRRLKSDNNRLTSSGRSS
jgi:hypothetical protein